MLITYILVQNKPFSYPEIGVIRNDKLDGKTQTYTETETYWTWDEVDKWSKIRYVYYGAPAQCTGTLYTELKDDTINGASFHRNSTIEETIESLESNWELVLFWIGWVLLTGGAVVGFYYIDNRWLEDRHTNHRRW